MYYDQIKAAKRELKKYTTLNCIFFFYSYNFFLNFWFDLLICVNTSYADYRNNICAFSDKTTFQFFKDCWI